MKKIIYISSLVLIAFEIVFYFKLAGGKDGEFEAVENNPILTSQSPQSGGWQLQVMPNMGSRLVRDLYFTDSLTGYAVASPNIVTDSAHILKTTNGGNNWNIKGTWSGRLQRIIFINENTGFAGGNYLLKTTNAGENWVVWNWPYGFNISDMQVFGEDTIWFGSSLLIGGGAYRTINGGINWEKRDNGIPANSYPDKIYFYNCRIGYAYQIGNSYSYKTTDAGLTWNQTNFVFTDLKFRDSLNGWRANSGMFRTSNGGNTWIRDSLPKVIGNIYTYNIITNFKNVNDSIIYSYGGYIYYYSDSTYAALIYKTTNGGLNWGYQIPDTSYHLFRMKYGFCLNKNNVWLYNESNKGIYTSTGGDTTIYLGINNISSEVSKNYILYQNCPNPFNPKSKIKYQITKKVKSQLSKVKLIIYDITGKQISTLVDRAQEIGDYSITFNGSNLSSGIYFYTLFADGIKIDTKKAILIK